MEKREKLTKKLALLGFGTRLCPGRKCRNFTKYQNCKGCKRDKSWVVAKEECLVFYDVERVNGNELSQPFSIGLVIMKSDSGEVLDKKEIIVMPENIEEVNKVSSNIHRMSVYTLNGVKTVMYRPKDWKQKPYELPSVSVQVAADQVVEFMKKITVLVRSSLHGPLGCHYSVLSAR